jgi:ankyrin repeat protein
MQSRWLVFDAIIEDQPIRLDLLLQKGANMSGGLRWLTNGQIDALPRFHELARNCMLDRLDVSPLCCAILYDRNHMIERLLAGGASVDDPCPGRGLAPIHIAAMIDSLEAFKCLESHGANLSLRDGGYLDMMYYLLNSDARRELDKSLLHYLVEHRKSYSQYSWSHNPAFMNRKV